jgi:hypothetical protein
MAGAIDDQVPMTDRVIAEVRSYPELIEAFRERLHELNATQEAVDELAGLPLRYTSKIFAPFPIKTVGKVSLGPILGALCCRIALIEDRELLAKFGPRILGTRKNSSPKTRTTKPAQRNWIFANNPDLARQFQARWVLQTTPRQRRRWGLQGGRPKGKRGRRGG